MMFEFYKPLFGRIVTIRNVLLFSLIIRVPMLVLSPPSLFIDGIDRYIPDGMRFLEADFSSWTPPVYSMCLTLVIVLFPSFMEVLGYKLFSLLVFILAFREAVHFLRNIRCNEKYIAWILILWSMLSWTLLLSVAILPDMLFTLLFLAIINKLITYQDNWKAFLVLCVLVLLFAGTKPMALVLLPGFIAFIFAIIHNKTVLLKVLSALFIGYALFSPWLVKNYFVHGSIYQTIGQEEERSALSFIGFESLPGQIEKSFAYFWEYPSYSAVQAFEEGNIRVAAQGYYGANLLVFMILSMVVIYSYIRSIREKGTKDMAFSLLALITPCVVFSVLYFPFFAKYNYWDTGRYVFPVLLPLLVFVPNLITVFKKRVYRGLLYSVFVFAVVFSIINAYGVVYSIRVREEVIRNMLTSPEIQSLESNIEYYTTNDTYLLEVVEYQSNQHVIYNPDIMYEPGFCSAILDNGRIVLCVTGEELLIINQGILARETK
ncbi:MAG: hypothetical protein ACOCXT_01160 [Candidatus Dojkabacteria bacterium]